jgi:hypothetical protein
MANSKSSSWKNCVTCERWGGSRKASTFRDSVEYNSEQDKGECIGGGWDRTQTTAMGSCGKWAKWGVLK